MAILLQEGLARSGTPRPVQIFATDIDDRAIEVARAGLYPATIAADLSAERLERHFTQEDGNYRVAKSLREMFLFSTHDLVKDPPFSRLDLVSCRNLLIYFDPSCSSGCSPPSTTPCGRAGILFLGPSEGGRRSPSPVRAAGQAASALCPTGHAGAAAGLSLRAVGHAWRRPRGPCPADDQIGRQAARPWPGTRPAFVVVDGQQDILRFSGQVRSIPSRHLAWPA